MPYVLLSYGANPLRKDEDGIPPLIHAVQLGNEEIIGLINSKISEEAWDEVRVPETQESARQLAERFGLEATISKKIDVCSYLNTELSRKEAEQRSKEKEKRG